MPEYVTGDYQLDKRLEAVGNRIARKAIASGLRAGLNTVVRAIRQEVDNQRVKKVVASRFKRKTRLGITEAKAGAGVGKGSGSESSRGRPGVGISKQNAHWYFLGTSARFTKAGARRGRMPKSNAVSVGYAVSKQLAMSKVRNKIAEVIDKEVRKMKGR